MFKAVLVTTILLATPAMARDLLAPGNYALQHPVAKANLVADATPEPFTSTPRQAGYLCSISGLGKMGACTMRSWSERRGAYLLAAR